MQGRGLATGERNPVCLPGPSLERPFYHTRPRVADKQSNSLCRHSKGKSRKTSQVGSVQGEEMDLNALHARCLTVAPTSVALTVPATWVLFLIFTNTTQLCSRTFSFGMASPLSRTILKDCPMVASLTSF